MNTKTIARQLDVPVTWVNDTARDLGITHYDSRRRCWVIPEGMAAQFIDHLIDMQDFI